MKQEEIKKIQEISLDVLMDIKEVCDKNGIEFFLLYGTLLGAIRHDGFIPWDDDIDIGMTRNNYLKFLKVASSELNKRDKVFIMGSGETKYVSEIKVGRRGTKYCLKDSTDLNIMDEIGVDIFMVDYMRNHPYKLRPVFNRMRKLLMLTKLNWDEKRLLIRRIKASSKRIKVPYILGLYLLHGIRSFISEKGLEYMVYKLYVGKEHNAKNFGVMTGDSRVRYWPTGFSTVSHVFEGIMMPIPSCYDAMLKESYGDYMQMPPEDKRYRKDINDWFLKS